MGHFTLFDFRSTQLESTSSPGRGRGWAWMILNRHLQFIFVPLIHSLIHLFIFFCCFLFFYLIILSIFFFTSWNSKWWIYIKIKCEQRLIYWFSTNKLFTLFSRHHFLSLIGFFLVVTCKTATFSKGNNNIALNRFVCDTL